MSIDQDQLNIIVQVILNLTIEIGRCAIHELRTRAMAGQRRPTRRRTMKRVSRAIKRPSRRARCD